VKNILVFVLAVFARSGFAAELTIVEDGVQKYALSSEAESDFNDFLGNEREALLRAIPELHFPQDPGSLRDGVSKSMMASSPAYENRAVGCRFFDRLSRTVNPDLKRQILELTDEGRICGPGDVEVAKRTAWAQSFADFLWRRPWIQNGTAEYSLKAWLRHSLGISIDIEPEIRVVDAVEYDGFGSAYSVNDLVFINSHGALAQMYLAMKDYDPDHPELSPSMGPQVDEQIRKDPVSFGISFKLRPTIYISNSWAPQDMVELLAHEFGHVYHALNKTDFYSVGEQIRVKRDRVFDEAAAEIIAWNGLIDLYGAYPEIKVSHIFKLHIFSLYRKGDPHLVGAAGMYGRFHSIFKARNDLLQEFLESGSIGEYVNSKQLTTLLPSEREPESARTYLWQDAN
jgi:hypothetical protein